jgi:hypothetical protein
MQRLTKADRSRNLRYKRPALKELGYEMIQAQLEEMRSECYEIHWAFDDDETLVNAFDGNEEEAWEFKWMFSTLEGEIERLIEAITENFGYIDDPETEFNDMSVALIGNRYNLIGWDDEEEDYFNLTGYDSGLAFSEAGKRVMRLTKKEMLAQIGQTLGLILSYQNVSMKYEALKSTIDIFRDNNVSILQVVKDIEEAYRDMFKGQAYKSSGYWWSLDREAERRFDKLVDELPDRYWIE